MKECKCDICGKMYIRPAKQVYKLEYKRKMYKCCSYTCYRIVQQVKEGQIESLEDYLNEKVGVQQSAGS